MGTPSGMPRLAFLAAGIGPPEYPGTSLTLPRPSSVPRYSLELRQIDYWAGSLPASGMPAIARSVPAAPSEAPTVSVSLPRS